MLKFWCHENETGFLYFEPLCKRSLSILKRTILRSPVTIWPHGAYRNSESHKEQGVGFWERPWKTCFVIEHFGSNRAGKAIRNAWRVLILIVWTDFILDGFLIQHMLLKFKASMPLLANLTFRNGLFLVSVGSPTLTALKTLLEEIFKKIPWSRCFTDAKSVKCKVNDDSYSSCSIF